MLWCLCTVVHRQTAYQLCLIVDKLRENIQGEYESSNWCYVISDKCGSVVAAAKKVPLFGRGVDLDNRDTSFGVKVVANGHWKLVKNEIHINDYRRNKPGAVKIVPIKEDENRVSIDRTCCENSEGMARIAEASHGIFDGPSS